MVGGWREHVCLAGTSFCYILSSVLDEGRAFWLLLKVQPHGVNNSIQIKFSSLITNKIGGQDNVRGHTDVVLHYPWEGRTSKAQI